METMDRSGLRSNVCCAVLRGICGVNPVTFLENFLELGTPIVLVRAAPEVSSNACPPASSIYLTFTTLIKPLSHCGRICHKMDLAA